MKGAARLVLGLAWLAAAFVGAGVASAQTGTVVAPSLGIGAGYDTNVFWQPTTTNLQRADSLWRVTPGITVRNENAHDTWGGSYSFDAERYQNHPDLSTTFARQSATLYDHSALSPFTQLGVDARFDSTLSPTDLNLTTGIIVGRVRASRWEADPFVSRDLSSRLQLRGSYHVSLDQLDISQFQAGSRVLTNAADGEATFKASPRDDLVAEYRYERFDFAEGTPIFANVVLAGWAFRMTPATTFSVKGGPRWSLGRVVPEIDANLIRRQGPSEASVSYDRTETTAIGIPGVVDVQRALAKGIYRHPGVFEASVEGGFFSNSQRTLTGVSDLNSHVYHVAASLTVPFGTYLSVQGTYALDWQKGAIAIGVAPALPLTIDPSGTVNRQLVFVQFVVSRPLSPLPKSRQSGSDVVRRP